MGIEWSEESAYKKELNKWNTPRRDGGYRPDGFEEFPKMLYKAQINPMSHRYEVAVAHDVVSLDRTTVLLDAEAFNKSCQLVVPDKRAEERALAEGWRHTPPEAMAYREGLENDIARAAAERAAKDSKMGERAQAEAKAADQATAKHLPEIPEQPIKRRGRRAKVA